ncbi:MAG TPA: histidinol-phosphatase HisJ, partial [Bacilli bacterium]|nr:histidinol-phosphatase HisJ [Bacilli bacterium]
SGVGSSKEADLLDEYLSSVLQLKEKYKGKCNILVGLEVDFIEGYEEDTKRFLNQVGPHLDDSILSVHFLKDKEGRYHCLDFNEDVFAEMIDTFGTVKNIYDCYFQTVKQSIMSNLGTHKPKRIGHLTLVTKFQQAFPPTFSYDQQVEEILDLIKAGRFAVDYNSAGVVKPLCKEPYPPKRFVTICENKNIPLVYGSDAHTVKGLLQGADKLKKGVHFSAPL